MILYNITIKIEHGVHDDWLHWMQQVHIPEMMATGFVEEYKFSRLLGVDEEDGFTYAVQYLMPSMEAYRIYQEKHAYRLQSAHIHRYKGQFVAFRSVLRVIEQG